MKKCLLLLLPLQAMAQTNADNNNWFRINTNFVENPATVGENGKRVVKASAIVSGYPDDAIGISFQTKKKNPITVLAFLTMPVRVILGIQS